MFCEFLRVFGCRFTLPQIPNMAVPTTPAYTRVSRTQFSGYAVKFSPFRANLIAVATSQYYGIAGNGKLLVLDADRNFLPLAEFCTRDGCFDVAWSEKAETVLAAATGDGSVKIFDSTRPGSRPVADLSGHSAETYSVDWNLHLRDLICSASWDRSVRVWDVSCGVETQKFFSHSAIAYEAKWSVRNSKLLGSVGGDGMLHVSDIGSSSFGRSAISIAAHQSEVLCLDWSKYNEHVVATGSVDKTVRVWDLRNPQVPVAQLCGHQLAVRRVKFSPHSDALLASCSYDMTVKVWAGLSQHATSFEHHSEFVIGLDWSNFRRDVIASVGWDRVVAVWTVKGAQTRQSPVVRLAAS